MKGCLLKFKWTRSSWMTKWVYYVKLLTYFSTNLSVDKSGLIYTGKYVNLHRELRTACYGINNFLIDSLNFLINSLNFLIDSLKDLILELHKAKKKNCQVKIKRAIIMLDQELTIHFWCFYNFFTLHSTYLLY